MLAVANSRKPGCGLMHAALVEQRQPARLLQHALDHEHHVRPAGVVFVETDGDVVLQRPGQNAVAELRHLLAVLQHDRVLADEIDARDVAVEVDAHQRPVEPGGDLLDMGRLAGAVIARDHHAAVVGEAGQDRQRGLPCRTGSRDRPPAHARRAGYRPAPHVGIDAEHFAHRHLAVRRSRDGGMIVRPGRSLDFHRTSKPRRSGGGARTLIDDPRSEEKAGSDQLLAAQEIVRLDDLAQLLLRRTVAAVGVGVMASSPDPCSAP